ncbi:MAG: ATP-binding protein, partial [Terracidiphilus sp.]
MTELPMIDAERPWPGLLPFTEDARMFFHGREAETDDLFRLIEREPLTVLFGQSGLGKSSLLNAGVFPSLRRAGYLPVYLRLNLDATAPALIEQVWHALFCECVDHEVSATEPQQGDDFWQYLHRPSTQFLNPHGRPVVPVLVFDQFEEIFTLGRQTPGQHARTRVLLQQLGELIENRLPPALESELTEHPERMDEFDLLRQNVKIVFTFREDYLAEFEGLKTLIRPIMQNRMRLEPMRGDRAAKAIQQAGAGRLSAAVAARIVRF